MFHRAAWFGAGAVTAVWAQRKARKAAQRFTPPAIASSAAEAARSRGRNLAAALQEGRQAMREREVELRAELDAEGPGASIHTLTPRPATADGVESSEAVRPDRRRAERRRTPAPPP